MGGDRDDLLAVGLTSRAISAPVSAGTNTSTPSPQKRVRSSTDPVDTSALDLFGLRASEKEKERSVGQNSEAEESEARSSEDEESDGQNSEDEGDRVREPLSPTTKLREGVQRRANEQL